MKSNKGLGFARFSAFAAIAFWSGAGELKASPGEFDPTFGSGGVVLRAFTEDDDWAYAIAIQADQKILLAGGSAGGDFSILRVLPGGGMDPEFGIEGRVVQSFGIFELSRGIRVVEGGKILVGGAGLVGGVSRDFAVLRLLPDGRLDEGYGVGGVAILDLQGGFNEQAQAMGVDDQGRAIMVGSSRGNVAMVRFTADGKPDPSFGQQGKVFSTVTGATQEQANAIAIQKDGRLLVVGESRLGDNTDVLISRYLANGELDPDFGDAGRRRVALGAGNVADVAKSVVILPTGSFLIAGTSNGDYALARFTSNGQLDPGFGTAGFVTIGFNGAVDEGNGLAVQSDGKIIVVGTTHLGNMDYAGVLRFTPDGALDPSFAKVGGFATTLSVGSSSGRAVALQSDGKILVAGDSGVAGNRDFAVARLQAVESAGLASWRQAYFGTTLNEGSAADAWDFDGDGLANLLEYAFGQDPRSALSNTVPGGAIFGGEFVLRFTAPELVEGISYGAEWRSSLVEGTWQPLVEQGAGRDHLFKVALAEGQSGFLRWVVRSQ